MISIVTGISLVVAIAFFGLILLVNIIIPVPVDYHNPFTFVRRRETKRSIFYGLLGISSGYFLKYLIGIDNNYILGFVILFTGLNFLPILLNGAIIAFLAIIPCALIFFISTTFLVNVFCAMYLFGASLMYWADVTSTKSMPLRSKLDNKLEHLLWLVGIILCLSGLGYFICSVFTSLFQLVLR